MWRVNNHEDSGCEQESSCAGPTGLGETKPEGQKQRGGLMPSTLAWHCPSELHCVPQAGPAHLQHSLASGGCAPLRAAHCSHTTLMGSCPRPGCSQGTADLGVQHLLSTVRGLGGPQRSTWGGLRVLGLVPAAEDQARGPGAEAPPAVCSSDRLPRAPGGVALLA